MYGNVACMGKNGIYLYVYIVFVDINMEYIYLACSLFDVGLL